MRITNNMMIANTIRNLGNNQQRLSKYQDQLDTGKKISVPSDDPVVAARALKLRTDVAKVEQYKKNINDAKSWLELTDESLSKLGDVLHKARELTVQASNGTNTQGETQKIALEIKQLRAQVIHIANSTYAGRYIFSGYKTDQKLIQDENTGAFALDVSTNTEKILYEIGVGDSININVAGGDLFNSNDILAGGVPDVDNGEAVTGQVPSMIAMFDRVISLMDQVDTYKETVGADQVGKFELISKCLDTFDKEMGTVLRVRADVGARVNRVDLSLDRMESDLINFTKLMSENEDVDVAETIMNLKNEENVYKASLAGGARIIQQTLVDFLR